MRYEIFKQLFNLNFIIMKKIFTLAAMFAAVALVSCAEQAKTENTEEATAAVEATTEAPATEATTEEAPATEAKAE